MRTQYRVFRKHALRNAVEAIPSSHPSHESSQHVAPIGARTAPRPNNAEHKENKDYRRISGEYGQHNYVKHIHDAVHAVLTLVNTQSSVNTTIHQVTVDFLFVLHLLSARLG